MHSYAVIVIVSSLRGRTAVGGRGLEVETIVSETVRGISDSTIISAVQSEKRVRYVVFSGTEVARAATERSQTGLASEKGRARIALSIMAVTAVAAKGAARRLVALLAV